MSTIGPTQIVGFLTRLNQDIPAIELSIREAAGKHLIALLLEGEIDVGLIGLPSFPDRLNAIPLYSERYTIAFAQGHAFEQMNTVPLAQLDGEDYLVRLHCEFADHFEAMGFEASHEVKVRYSSEREDWIQAMVLAWMGCTVMPEFLPLLPGIATRSFAASLLGSKGRNALRFFAIGTSHEGNLSCVSPANGSGLRRMTFGPGIGAPSSTSRRPPHRRLSVAFSSRALKRSRATRNAFSASSTRFFTSSGVPPVRPATSSSAS